MNELWTYNMLSESLCTNSHCYKNFVISCIALNARATFCQFDVVVSGTLLLKVSRMQQMTELRRLYTSPTEQSTAACSQWSRNQRKEIIQFLDGKLRNISSQIITALKMRSFSWVILKHQRSFLLQKSFANIRMHLFLALVHVAYRTHVLMLLETKVVQQFYT